MGFNSGFKGLKILLPVPLHLVVRNLAQREFDFSLFNHTFLLDIIQAMIINPVKTKRRLLYLTLILPTWRIW